MGNTIQTVSDYIQVVREKSQAVSAPQAIIVFRGEAQLFQTHCQPNIFRKGLLESDPLFEKNLFEEMTANRLTDGKTYLEKAIDAQHGGFPSRLLDVTYNCLVALYFAVTPFYHQDEASLDDKDGVVYLFALENMYCPTGLSINDAYDACILRDQPWFCGYELFAKNHKLIDHIKKNPRIIAQQGAFILFQGDYFSPISEDCYEVIHIPKSCKAELRKELRTFFGIHTGSIYPEESNLVEEMIQKSGRVISKEFSFREEVNLVLHGMERMIDYELDKLEMGSSKIYQTIIEQTEQELYGYRMGFIQLKEEWIKKKQRKEDWSDRVAAEDLQYALQEYNTQIAAFAERADYIMSTTPEAAVSICREELMISPIEKEGSEEDEESPV